MKIAFKIFSVLLIIASAVEIIIGALLIFATDMLFEMAGEAGMAATFGAAGMIISVVGAIVVAAGIWMLLTGINGMRGRIEKCKKSTFIFLILTAVNFVLSLVQNSNTGSAFLWVLFFGVYYFLAKMYMKYDNNY